MKILTLNCQRGYRKESLHKFLNKLVSSGKYAYFLLQELDWDSANIFKKAGYRLSILDEDLSRACSSVALAYRNPPVTVKVFRIPFEKEITRLHTYNFGLVGLKVDNHVIASVHMPAYFLNVLKRRRYLKKVMSTMRKYCDEGTEVLIGGDWNTLWFYERDLLQRMVKPLYKFFKAKNDTYISARVETGLFWNNILFGLSKIINVKLTTDYFLAQSDKKFVPRTIDEIVSDHLPVELSVEP